MTSRKFCIDAVGCNEYPRFWSHRFYALTSGGQTKRQMIFRAPTIINVQRKPKAAGSVSGDRGNSLQRLVQLRVDWYKFADVSEAVTAYVFTIAQEQQTCRLH